MKVITEEDMKLIDSELAIARKKFEEKNMKSLDEKLAWIRDFFNAYVPTLEERFMTKEELKDLENYSLPDEVRIKFYMHFPEHGLNMVKAYEKTFIELEKEKQYAKRFGCISRSYFRHYD